MTAERKRFYTLAEYFELVRSSDQRYEYYDGEVFCMSGGSPEHTLISDNVLTSLKLQLRGRKCRAMGADTAIKVPIAPPFRYADVLVACGEMEFERVDGIGVLTNPILIVEVLSGNSERYDRTGKFTLYKSIPTFQEYLLIAQNAPCITQFVKQAEGEWKPDEVTGLESSIYLPSVNCTLALNEIYQDIDFEKVAVNQKQ